MSPLEKRQTVPNVLHGTLNQVNKSMYHAFVLSYVKQIDFHLTTEDTAFGDFDDLIIKTTQDVTAIQYKHILKPSSKTALTINDLITKSGDGKELMLYIYYYSLTNKRPNWANEKNLHLELTTNNTILSDLERCLDPDTGHFHDAFFQENTELTLARKVCIASILKYSKDTDLPELPIDQVPSDLTPYISYLELIVRTHAQISGDILTSLHTVLINRDKARYSKDEKLSDLNRVFGRYRSGKRRLVKETWNQLLQLFNRNVFSYSNITHIDVLKAEIHPKNSHAIAFLRKIKICHSQKGKNDTIKEIKKLLNEEFKCGIDAVDILYNAFFIEFLDWLASTKPISLTRDEIKHKFDVWKDRFLYLQRWIGISKAYDKNINVSIDNYHFSREAELQSVRTFDNSSKRALVIYGDRGAGKSALMKSYINRNLQLDSDYLFLDINVILKSLEVEDKAAHCSFQYFNSCRIIIIDNCEQIRNATTDLAQKFENLLIFASKNIKFCFLFRADKFVLSDKLFGIEKSMLEIYKISKLDLQKVIKQYPFIYGLTQPDQMTVFKRNRSDNLLNDYATTPFYLNLLILYYKKTGHFNINLSSTENFVRIIMQEILTAAQMGIIQKLIFLISQNKSTESLKTSIELPALLENKIIINDQDGFKFSHKLYEEWALRIVVEQRLEYLIAANDSIYILYDEFARTLTGHRENYFIFLSQHTGFSEYLKSIYKNEFLHLHNNNMIYLFLLIKDKNYQKLIDAQDLLYLLVDLAPIELCRFLLAISLDTVLCRRLLNNKSFHNCFYTVLIRCFCISEDVITTGQLYFNILSNLDKTINKSKSELDQCMSTFFVKAFCGFNSMGLMSFESRLKFFRHHLNSEESLNDIYYFQYIYQGLLMAADPALSGDASYPEHGCYFRSRDLRHFNGYADYRGNFYSFIREDAEEQDNYIVNSLKLLIEGYNKDSDEGNFCLNDIIKIFELNIGDVERKLQQEHISNFDVASVIAANIKLDNELLKQLRNIVNEKMKIAEEEYSSFKSQKNDEKTKASAAVFNPHVVFRLQSIQANRIRDILQWRFENSFKQYDIGRLKLRLNEDNNNLDAFKNLTI